MPERTITVERIEYCEYEDGSIEDLTTAVVSTVTIEDDLTPAEWDAKVAAALASTAALKATPERLAPCLVSRLAIARAPVVVAACRALGRVLDAWTRRMKALPWVA